MPIPAAGSIAATAGLHAHGNGKRTPVHPSLVNRGYGNVHGSSYPAERETRCEHRAAHAPSATAAGEGEDNCNNQHDPAELDQETSFGQPFDAAAPHRGFASPGFNQ